MTHSTKLSRRAVLAGLAAAPATAGLLTGGLIPSVAFAQEGTVVTMMAPNEAPALLSFVNTSSLIWSAHVSEGLLEFDHDMNPTPLLATEWDVSEDGLTYTFKLREGVKWHDGEDFTSEDVKFTILTSKEFHSRNRSTFAQITEVETPDDHTVILHLANPTSFLLRAFSSMETPIVPSHLYAEGENVLTHPNNTAPIGTGPFVFREWVRGSHVLWDKNTAYWNPELPKVDRLVARFIPDAAARTIAFETGDIDIGYRTPIPFRDIEQLQATGVVDFTEQGYAYDPPNIIIVEANLRDPLLADIRIRQAIAHCIDREMINRVVFFNYATPSASPVVPYHKDFHLAEGNPMPWISTAPRRCWPRRATRVASALRWNMSAMTSVCWVNSCAPH
ncbi:ABC transporter substrate-binding protein [Ketogulonicigenium vulgare]|uniref:ABC transporter substrate-binding protein n=1 Tax=Ketogulonicigenium vulgare TaxID=92945 RepID=UPI000A671C4F|nr:ABC transporter substrate-binding protein [Ketogulonicigenium vulgare]